MTNKDKKNLAKAFIPLVAAGFLLLVAAFWGNAGDEVRFMVFLATAIIVGLQFPGLIVVQKLEERFDRLEELLKERSPSTEGDLKRGEDTTGEGESQGK